MHGYKWQIHSPRTRIVLAYSLPPNYFRTHEGQDSVASASYVSRRHARILLVRERRPAAAFALGQYHPCMQHGFGDLSTMIIKTRY